MKNLEMFQFRDTGTSQKADPVYDAWDDMLSLPTSGGTAYEYKLDNIMISSYGTAGSGDTQAALLLPAVQAVRETSSDTPTWDDFSMG